MKRLKLSLLLILVAVALLENRRRSIQKLRSQNNASSNVSEAQHSQQEQRGKDDPTVDQKDPTSNRQCTRDKHYCDLQNKQIWGIPADRAIELFFALIITVFTGLLWWTSSDQLDAMREQIDAMKGQIQVMDSSLQVQQRAYVNVQNIELLSFKVGKRPEARILYKNSGLTPANHLLVVPDSFLFKRPSVGPYPAPPPIYEEYISCAKERGPGPILPPGVTRTVNTLRMAINKGPLEPLTSKSLTDMRQMDTTWFVVVYTAYFDSFGDCHRTVEPFEFDPFTQTFTPTSINAIPDQSDNRHTKKQPQP